MGDNLFKGAVPEVPEEFKAELDALWQQMTFAIRCKVAAERRPATDRERAALYKARRKAESKVCKAIAARWSADYYQVDLV